MEIDRAFTKLPLPRARQPADWLFSVRMIKLILATCLGVVVFLAPLRGQSHINFDSLWQVWRTTTGVGAIDAAQAIAKAWVYDSADWTLALLDSTLEQSLDIGYDIGVIRSYERKGVAYDVKGQTEKAIGQYDRALALLEEKPEIPYSPLSLIINKGVAYYFSGDMGRALEQNLEAEQLAIAEGKRAELSYILNNLGVIYRKLDKYDDAIRIYHRSLQIKEELNDRKGLANTYHNLGSAHVHQGKQAEAIQYFEQARQLFTELGDLTEVQSVSMGIGTGYFKLGDTLRAKAILADIFDKPHEGLSTEDAVEGLLVLARIMRGEGDPARSLSYLETAEKVVGGTSRNANLADVFLQLSKTHEALGSQAEAFRYLKAHMDVYEQLKSEERQKLQEEMEAKYSNYEKSTQIRLQQLELERVNRQRNAVIVGLAALFLIAGLLFWLFRTRSRANRELARKNDQIREALGEKEVLLREIHHRVKNNLQVISSLLSLQARGVEDPKALEVMKEGRNRVKSMALIHQNLYQDENLVGVDMAEYIDKLTRSLVSSYAISQDLIRIHTQVDPVKLDVDVIIPLGLILNELISNALKYAFPEERAGTIEVSFRQETAGWRLEVKDDGVGLPSGFSPGDSPSLGMFLIQSFAKKLHASFQLLSESGTSASLFIPSPQLA